MAVKKATLVDHSSVVKPVAAGRYWESVSRMAQYRLDRNPDPYLRA